MKSRRRRRKMEGEVVNTESGLDPHHQTHRREGGKVGRWVRRKVGTFWTRDKGFPQMIYRTGIRAN